MARGGLKKKKRKFSLVRLIGELTLCGVMWTLICARFEPKFRRYLDDNVPLANEFFTFIYGDEDDY